MLWGRRVHGVSMARPRRVHGPAAPDPAPRAPGGGPEPKVVPIWKGYFLSNSIRCESTFDTKFTTSRSGTTGHDRTRPDAPTPRPEGRAAAAAAPS